MFYALTAPQCDINLGSFVTCVDAQEPIKMPKSLKSHKVKKLIYNKHVVIGKYPSRSTPPPPELFWDHAKFSNCGLCKGQQEKHRRIKANKNNRHDLTSQSHASRNLSRNKKKKKKNKLNKSFHEKTVLHKTTLPICNCSNPALWKLEIWTNIEK